LGVTANKACPADGKDGPLPPTDTPASANITPYDYVTTVVFPACAVGSNKNDGKCGAMVGDIIKPSGGTGVWVRKKDGRGGTWSTVCSAEFCYGLPLYRQFLTGTGTSFANATREANRWLNPGTSQKGCNDDRTQAKCRWPFVRMSGQGTYQRSSM